MTNILVCNRRTKKQWVTSPHEALIYISRIYGLGNYYLAIEISSGRLLSSIELLTQIFQERKEQREKKNV